MRRKDGLERGNGQDGVASRMCNDEKPTRDKARCRPTSSEYDIVFGVRHFGSIGERPRAFIGRQLINALNGNCGRWGDQSLLDTSHDT